MTAKQPVRPSINVNNPPLPGKRRRDGDVEGEGDDDDEAGEDSWNGEDYEPTDPGKQAASAGNAVVDELDDLFAAAGSPSTRRRSQLSVNHAGHHRATTRASPKESPPQSNPRQRTSTHTTARISHIGIGALCA